MAELEGEILRLKDTEQITAIEPAMQEKEEKEEKLKAGRKDGTLMDVLKRAVD